MTALVTRVIRLSLASVALIAVFAVAGRVAETRWAAPFGVAVVVFAVALGFWDRPQSLERFERRRR